MRTSNDILKERQCAIRRELDRRGIALKAISFDSGIPYSSLLSYFPQAGGNDPAIMSAAVVYSLVGAIPTDLLSLLLPEGHAIVRVPDGIDHDEMDRACREYADAKAAAHHPESEAGREIGPGEDKTLRAKLTVITGGSVAA